MKKFLQMGQEKEKDDKHKGKDKKGDKKKGKQKKKGNCNIF